MEIAFADAKLQKLCSNQGKLVGKYGPRLAVVIQRRLADLEAAETLEVMRTLPGRCHELRENLSGCLAIDLVHPDRMVFRPKQPPPVNDDGQLPWNQVVAIEVVGIGDYHN